MPDAVKHELACRRYFLVHRPARRNRASRRAYAAVSCLLLPDTALGDLNQIFSKIEEKALASASIGQVHRAWLMDGTPVVVKVQHADVETLLMHDMANLKQLSWGELLLHPSVNAGITGEAIRYTPGLN